MADYFLSRQAQNDILDLYEQRGFPIVSKLEPFLEEIAERPLQGRTREDLTDIGCLWRIFLGEYLVAYWPTTPVEVITVVSGRRSLEGRV